MGCDGGPWGSYDGRDYVDWGDAYDVPDYDSEVDGGEMTDIDGGSDATEDGGEVVDQCTVGDRTGITNYARISCNPNNLIIANNHVFGACIDQIFSCPIGTPPATCSEAVEMPVGVDVEGTRLPVTTTRVVNIGSYLIGLYGADDEATGKSASGIMLINASSYEVLQHVVVVTTTFDSGSGPITLTPRQPTYAVADSRLRVSFANQNPTSDIYEPGFMLSMPTTTTGQIDQRNLGDTTFTFTGRDTQWLGLSGDSLFAYSPYGPPTTIPFLLKDVKIYVMNNRLDSIGYAQPISPPVNVVINRIPVLLDPLPGEPTGPAIIPYDLSDPANPQRVDADSDTHPDVINFDDVYLGDELLAMDDYAVAASGTSAALHMANLSTYAVVSRDMSSTVSGVIVSIAHSGMRVFAVSDDNEGPNFHGIDVPFTPASTIGSGIYVGADAGEAACDGTTGLCFVPADACGADGRWLVEVDTSVTTE